MIPAVVDPRYLNNRVISYPISDIPGLKCSPEQGIIVLSTKDRIALLDPYPGSKWSRVRITDHLVLGVGAVGPIYGPYITFSR